MGCGASQLSRPPEKHIHGAQAKDYSSTRLCESVVIFEWMVRGGNVAPGTRFLGVTSYARMVLGMWRADCVDVLNGHARVLYCRGCGDSSRNRVPQASRQTKTNGSFVEAHGARLPPSTCASCRCCCPSRASTRTSRKAESLLHRSRRPCPVSPSHPP